jgi:hypothetical protein
MTVEYQKRLEKEVDRKLKDLPELIAPPTLMLRILAAIERRLHLPWYQQSWQRWPIAIRAAALVLLLAMFGVVCFGTWKLSHLETVSTAMQRPLGWLAEFGAIWHALGAVANAVLLALKHAGTGFLIACFAALALGYALCVGLGTFYIRLGMAEGRTRIQ